MRCLLAGGATIAVLAACGGAAKHAQPTATTSAAAPIKRAITATQATAATQTTTTTYPQTTSHTSTAGASNVRLPATFTIGPGDRLTPPSVTSPAGVLIGLMLISGDGRAHRVKVAGKALVVPAGSHTNAALQGLHAGRYPLIVDGVPRGTLIVGGQVGP